ncbi:MAG: BON domain-containing protein [Pirellulaceae bacterium]|nr:BON domain-containing protein [Pirellulaceae bacterium]
MRRFFLGLAIASLTAAAPVTAFGGDREIADNIISSIKKQQSDGSLKGFDIDLSVEAGIVTLTGSVANYEQAASVLMAAHEARGVSKVIDEISVRDAKRSSRSAETLVMAAESMKSNSPVQRAAGAESNDEMPMLLNYEVSSPKLAETVAAEPPKMQNAVSAVTPHDAAITDEALQQLGKAKSAGLLRQFDLDISTVNGEVWVRGHVANAQQKQLVLRTVQQIQGVNKVIDDLEVRGTKNGASIQPASNTRVVEPQMGSMPVVGSNSSGPQPFAPSMVANHTEGMAASNPTAMMQSPMPMNMGPSHGAGVPRYDQPQMPGYAWPSYAAYPNYSAVTYPKQYSASAWPYIGPFYPYPQVPLGWRRVALEWDDGLWYLDFTSK